MKGELVKELAKIVGPGRVFTAVEDRFCYSSEGTLGVITEITVRLIPRPPCRQNPPGCLQRSKADRRSGERHSYRWDSSPYPGDYG